MDISASMRPYLHEKTVSNSAFRELLRRLAALDPQRRPTFAFGTPSSPVLSAKAAKSANSLVAGGQPPPWPMELAQWSKPATYSGLFNDYAALMKGFTLDSGVERLVISDGVLSSRASEASFSGATAGQIIRWIDQGGVFALFLLRAPYYCDDARGQFTYFSETLRERRPEYRVAFNTDARPFAIFAFLTSEAALESLKQELLDGLSGDRRWVLEIRKPDHIQPLDVLWAPDSKNKAMMKRMERLDVRGVPGGVIKCPLLPDPTGKGQTELQFTVKMRPEANARLPERMQRLLLQPDAFSARAWMVDIVPEKAIQEVSLISAKYDAVGSVVRLSAPEAPKDGRLRLWCVTLIPSPTLPQPGYDTDIAAWSTQQDDTPDTQDRILNLQALVDEICRQRAQARMMPSSALLVTH